MPLRSLEMEGGDSLHVVYTRLIHLQQGVLDGKTNTVFSDFIHCLSMPESAKHVSSRVAISTWSLLSSLLIAAVLRMLLIFWRSSGTPGVIDLMFQHPNLSAVFFFLFFVVLSGAWFTVLLSGGKALSPTRSVNQEDCGGTASYWLGTAQLEMCGSCPGRPEVSSHHLKQPLGPHPMPVKH